MLGSLRCYFHSTWAEETFLIQPNRGVECTIVVEPRGRLWAPPCSHRGEICFKLQGRHSETASGWFHVPQVSTFRCGRREFFPLFSSRVCLSVWVNCVSFLYASWPWLFLVVNKTTSFNGCAQHLTWGLQQRTCAPLPRAPNPLSERAGPVHCQSVG